MRTLPRSIRGARPRWLELGLLAFPILVLAVGLTTIDLARGDVPDSTDRALVVALSAALFAVHCWLTLRYPRADQVVLPTASMLAALSMVMVARLEPGLAVRQALWIGVGSAALLATLVILPG